MSHHYMYPQVNEIAPPSATPREGHRRPRPSSSQRDLVISSLLKLPGREADRARDRD